MVEVIRLEIKKRATYHEIESEKPLIIDGVKVCLNCGKPVPDGNRKYCSPECSLEYFAKHNQQGLRQYLEKREHGKCQGCGWQNPHFDKPFPAKPQFSKPRPEEHSFQHYTNNEHRIGFFKNQLIVTDQEVTCACGAVLPMGSECYCCFPEDTRCHMDCQKAVDPWKYRASTVVCKPVNIHCIDCGRKAIKEIEKSWNRDHRKALAAFKEAYRLLDAEYTAWVKSGVLKAYDDAVKEWNKAEADWQEANKDVRRRNFIADHIVPIALGGAEFDLTNLQWLCDECNKVKTAKDAADIARRRREAKALNGYARLTSFS